MSTNTSCGTVEVIPGDELHLTMLMAPMSLNFLVASDRQDLLAYAKSVWQASRKQALVDAAQVCAGVCTTNLNSFGDGYNHGAIDCEKSIKELK